MSATIQQAIDYMRRLLIAPPAMIPGIDKDTDSISHAIKALQEKQERENPEPLTLEELRQMDGEPVWIVAKHYRTFADVVRVMGRDKGDDFVGFKICHNLQENGHGKTWNAYRHKPKEKGVT